MESITERILHRLGGNARELASDVRYIYRSSGEPIAFIKKDRVFTFGLRWIGFLKNLDEFYSADDGTFIGYLLHDGRVVRVRGAPHLPRQIVPPRSSTPSKQSIPNRRNRISNLPNKYVEVFSWLRSSN